MIIRQSLSFMAFIWGLLGFGLATAQESCSDPTIEPRGYFLSAEVSRDDLLPVPNVAVGGSGVLSFFMIQQASDAGYRSVMIDAEGHEADGVEVLFSSAAIDEGVARFVGCSEQGFLVSAVYINDQGQVAGVPADVLGSSNGLNYANITAQSNARVGVNFNNGGAEDALAIIEAQLDTAEIERAVAELVLTENIASVFDFSESQAPVYGFDSADCVVSDRMILFKNGQTRCTGLLNPAVEGIRRIDGGQSTNVVDEDGQGTFVAVPNAMYEATIGEEDSRTVIFVGVTDDALPKPLSNDPMAPSALSFSVGNNVVKGQVDNPRNTRDVFTFEVPQGAQLTGIFLEDWSAGIDQGYVFIDEGATTVIASEATAGDFLGGLHVSSSLYGSSDDLLAFLGLALQGGVGFDVPLGPGQYTFTMQQTGPVESVYALKFVIE